MKVFFIVLIAVGIIALLVYTILCIHSVFKTKKELEQLQEDPPSDYDIDKIYLNSPVHKQNILMS